LSKGFLTSGNTTLGWVLKGLRAEFQRFYDTTLRECIVQRLKDVGFTFVSLDLEGLPIQPTGESDPPLARD